MLFFIQLIFLLGYSTCLLLIFLINKDLSNNQVLKRDFKKYKIFITSDSTYIKKNIWGLAVIKKT